MFSFVFSFSYFPSLLFLLNLSAGCQVPVSLLTDAHSLWFSVQGSPSVSLTEVELLPPVTGVLPPTSGRRRPSGSGLWPLFVLALPGAVLLCVSSHCTHSVQWLLTGRAHSAAGEAVGTVRCGSELLSGSSRHTAACSPTRAAPGDRRKGPGLHTSLPVPFGCCRRWRGRPEKALLLSFTEMSLGWVLQEGSLRCCCSKLSVWAVLSVFE